jgi:CubicO group peptidase (beta-lactamase class C family)
MTRFSTLILILLSVLSLHSQPVVRLTPSAPEVAGVSSDRLKRIDAYMQKHVDDGQLNGGTMIIVRKGRIVYHRAFGKSDLEKGTNMKRDDLFRIASMTKPVVSTAVMMLLEEGKFALDDPISKYIPDFAKPTVIQSFNEKDTSWTSVPAKSEITVRHLLSQTSGIGYAQIGSAQARAIYYKHGINGGIGTPGSTLKEVIPRLAKLPLFHHPGEKYLYGLNVDVLGYLVEIWSGMPLDRFMQERLFGPLGMKDTHFFLPREKHARLVPLYRQDEDMKLRRQDSVIRLNGDFYSDFPKTPGTFFSGGAGLTSSALDYAVFCQMFLNGGTYNGVRILSPHTIRMMTSNQIGTLSMGNPTDPNRFGLGFGVYTKGSEARTPAQEGSFDWGGMFATHFWIDPASDLACVFLRNIWPLRNGELQARLKNLVYQALTD